MIAISQGPKNDKALALAVAGAIPGVFDAGTVIRTTFGYGDRCPGGQWRFRP
jgi:hypothetical protein